MEPAAIFDRLGDVELRTTFTTRIFALLLPLFLDVQLTSTSESRHSRMIRARRGFIHVSMGRLSKLRGSKRTVAWKPSGLIITHDHTLTRGSLADHVHGV